VESRFYSGPMRADQPTAHPSSRHIPQRGSHNSPNSLTTRPELAPELDLLPSFAEFEFPFGYSCNTLLCFSSPSTRAETRPRPQRLHWYNRHRKRRAHTKRTDVPTNDASFLCQPDPGTAPAQINLSESSSCKPPSLK